MKLDNLIYLKNKMRTLLRIKEVVLIIMPKPQGETETVINKVGNFSS